MTPYIEAKKAEVREKWIKIDEQSWNERSKHPSPLVVCDFFLGEIDTLLDEIESRVVPMEALPSDWDDDDKPRLRASMYNQCRKDVTEAFQHLRTGVKTEV